MASPTAVRVRVDIREDDLIRELEPYKEGEDWGVETATMDIADIGFFVGNAETPTVILERKTAEDFGASQKDGRFREQRARLLASRGSGIAIGYIVEAPAWSPTLSRTWCRGALNEVQLQTQIARLQLRYTIPVFHAASIKETVQWIRRIAKALVADPTVYSSGMAATAAEAAAVYTEAIHVKKADNNTPERIFHAMLMAIPGLGKAAVEAIATATGHRFSALLALTELEISEISAGKRKIGKAIGAAVYAALHS